MQKNLAEEETLQYLAKQAINGNDECFVKLCSSLKIKLFRTAKGVLGNEFLALDAVSEAVFRAYKGIKKLREPNYVETWFIRIILNVANDYYRRKKHEILVESVPEKEYYDYHSELEFEQIIGILNPELRVIISLKYYSGYTLNEISNILGIPKGTVKSRLNKALNILRLEAENG